MIIPKEFNVEIFNYEDDWKDNWCIVYANKTYTLECYIGNDIELSTVLMKNVNQLSQKDYKNLESRTKNRFGLRG